MTIIKMFIHQLDHEAWANEKVIDALNTVGDDRQPDDRFQRAVDKLAHTMAARDIWLWRMGGRDARPEAVFPEGVDLALLPEWSLRCLTEWKAWLAELGQPALAEPVHYNSSDGAAYTNTRADIVRQTYTHGFYHRGQIAALLNQLGVEPPLIDWIFFVREAR